MTSMIATTTTEMRIPEEFICPITHDIMRDPLMCRNGLNFERDAIVDWLMHHNNTCPMTRQVLTPRDLLPNRALKARIESWCNVYNFKGDDEDEVVSGGAANEEDVESSLKGNNILLTCSVANFEEELARSAERRKKSKTSLVQTHEGVVTQRRRRSSLGRLFRRKA